MLSATVALFALLPFIAASPIQKRFSGVTIQSGRTGTCLTLTSAPSDGAPLSVGDCTTATKWDINPGSGSVVVSGTNFALDAGSNPSNNVPAKVWTSYPGLTQQTWYLTGDNRIAITGGTQCLDEGDNGPQTYQCTPGNTNQVWNVGGNGGGSGPSASSSMSMMPSASASASSSSSAPSASASAPSSGSKQIKWLQDPSQCLTAAVGAYNGAPITLGSCVTNSPNEASQLFVTNQGGVFQLAGTNFCLDAGSNPSNGGDLKLWQCYPGLGQQTYSAITNRRIQTINNQCIDVDNSNNVRMQTWTCSDSDRQQMFVY